MQEEIVLAARDGSDIALFPAKIGNYQTQCLWDTGATICLISKELVRRAGLKALLSPLPSAKLISGLANAKVCATHQVQTSITFSDGVNRDISCIVCDSVPHDLLIGLNFMAGNDISFEVDPEQGFQLKDKQTGAVIASTAGEDPSDEVFVAIEDNTQHGIKINNFKGAIDKDLNEAFQYKLKDDVTLESVLTALLATDEFEIDTQGLAPEILQSLDQHSCHFAQPAEPELPESVIKWDLKPDEQAQLDALVKEFDDIFSEGEGDVGAARFEPVHIKLLKKEPVATRNYRTPLEFRDWLKTQLGVLKESDIIENSSSSYNSPALVVSKKLDKGQQGVVNQHGKAQGCRLVVDYRKVNEVLEDVNFPIPRIQDLLLNLRGCDVFSVMDIRHAFFTIELHPESRKITAFSCEFGKYQFKYLPQGLKISPAIFQQKIHDTLEGLEHSHPYIDDITTGTKGVQKHLQALREVFTEIRRVNFKFKKSKCQFLCKQVITVGRMVSEKGVHIDPTKIRDVLKMVSPKTVGDVRTMLGFTGFLREHVEHYNDITAPIGDLVIKGKGKSAANIECYWDDRCKESFEELKRMLVSNQVLKFPEIGKPYELFTDASGRHMSGVLMQEGQPCGYFAKSFKGTQCAWAALTKEAHAVYRSVEFFHVFITASKVTLRCDHKPLYKFLRGDTRNMMVNRWSIAMQQYDITFEWVATDKNISDCLSRMIESGLYEPHEPVADDFDPFPKSMEALTAKMDKLVVKEVQLPRALRNEDMKSLQRSNAYCKRIKEQMRSNREVLEKFVIKDELLFKIVRDRKRVRSLALVIPPKLGLTAIVSVHLELSHPGETAMIQTLKARVYWRGMSKNIRAYVNGCPVCQIKNLKRDSYEFKHDQPPLKPWRRLAIDLAGQGYGKTPDGNVAVLTAICMHSQYPFAEPIKDKTAKSVVQAMMKILNTVNTCCKVLSDNGPEFKSAEFAQLMKAYGIKHRFTAPYCPQSNGILERWHRFMNGVVRICEAVRTDEGWEMSVQAALKAYRTIPHTTTGYSPHYLAYKEEPRLDLDRMMPTRSSVPCDETNTEGALSHFKLAFGLARKNVCLARLRNKNVRANTQDGTLKPGDMVTLRDNAASKGQSPWKIGYKILQMCSDRTAQIEHLESGKKYRTSVTHLKKSEPLSILLENSNIDLFPGGSKLYLPAADMPDLNWSAAGLSNEKLSEGVMNKIMEAVKDRGQEQEEQVPLEEVVEPMEVDPAPSDAMTRVPDQVRRDERMEIERKQADRPTTRSRTTRAGRKVKSTRDSNFVYCSPGVVPLVRGTGEKVFVVGIDPQTIKTTK